MHQLALYVRATFIESDSLRAAARGMAWLVASSAFSQAATLLASILAARLLGQTAFGQLGLIRSTVLMLGTLAGAGLGLAATKYAAEFRDSAAERAGRLIGLLLNVALGMSVLISTGCCLLAEPLAESFLHDPSLAGPLRLSCLLIVLNTLNGVLGGALAGLEAFRAMAVLSLLEATLSIALIGLGAWAFGLTGAVAGSVVVMIAAVASRQFVLCRQCRGRGFTIRHRELSVEITSLWRFALPAVLVQLSMQPFEWFARMLMAREVHGYDELGVFTAAFSLGQIVSFLPLQMIGASAPVLANQFAAGNLAAFRRIVQASLLSTLLSALLAALPLICAARWVMAAYGPAFASGSTALVVLMAAFIVAAGALTLRTVFISSGLIWQQVGHSLLFGVTLVVASWLLAKHGATGFALAYLFAFGAIFLVQGISSVLRGLLFTSSPIS